MSQSPNPQLFPQDTWTQVQTLLQGLSTEQQTWLSGYLAGLSASSQTSPSVAIAAPAPKQQPPLTILYGTESGNSEELAHRTLKKAKELGSKARVFDMAEYPGAKLGEEENLLVLVSTWGDGDPPDSALDFYDFLHSDEAPTMEKTRFSVLALGDTSYEQFCKTGKDMDSRFEQLGANRIFPRQDCDVDFDAPFESWLAGALPALLEAPAAENGNVMGVAAPAAPPPPPEVIKYDKKNPFPAPLEERILLNGSGSKKEIYHLEFSLEGSGLVYEPGDSLGVIPQNDPVVVDGILKQTGLDPESPVETDAGTLSLRKALLEYFEITVLTSSICKKYAEYSGSKELQAMLEPSKKDALKDWLYGKQLADLVFDFPAPSHDPSALTGLLRKLPARLYSIASSQKAHPDRVHLTVGAVRYERHDLPLNGVASTYLSDRVLDGSNAPVYIQSNRSFRLPENPDTPVIMVGPGTGIAPFRAFIEERKATGAKGQNWLFFGDQHFNTDFLYQLEWQDYLKDGILTRLNTAFSRDQKHKIYVQDRMNESAAELFAWLEDGAHFYVCGDASRMAKDVHDMLISIVETQGSRSREDAEAYVKQLQRDKRYQRDVY